MHETDTNTHTTKHTSQELQQAPYQHLPSLHTAHSHTHTLPFTYHATPEYTAWKSSRDPTTFQFSTSPGAKVALFAYPTGGTRTTCTDAMAGVMELKSASYAYKETQDHNISNAMRRIS